MKVLVLTTTFALCGVASAQGATCDSLRMLRLDATTIDSVTSVAANGIANVPNTPPMCRVLATVRPAPGSDIHVEVWLPLSGWNHNFQAVGNMGYAGVIRQNDMATAIRAGYATAGTDVAPTSGRGMFLQNPDQRIDFGYRAIHEMTVMGKAVATAFYDEAPRESYYFGCSTGGRQGLMAAQRYPNDFDGIVAGAPVNYMTHMTSAQLFYNLTFNAPGARLSDSQMSMLHKAVLTSCDAADGVADGVLENPMRCQYDPGALLCRAGATTDCLTETQIAAMRKIYAGPKNPASGDSYYPGLTKGGEMRWFGGLLGAEPISFTTDFWRYGLLNDPNWDYKTFDISKDIARADAADAGIVNAVDADLRPFFKHGGKLLQYHGWSDQVVPPVNSINYYQAVSALNGASTNDNYRLFMFPGMTHCQGGDGPDQFDPIAILSKWVEQGQAPSAILATKSTAGKVERTRPVCAYPQIAVYTGSGSTDDAANFSCRTN